MMFHKVTEKLGDKFSGYYESMVEVTGGTPHFQLCHLVSKTTDDSTKDGLMELVNGVVVEYTYIKPEVSQASSPVAEEKKQLPDGVYDIDYEGKTISLTVSGRNVSDSYGNWLFWNPSSVEELKSEYADFIECGE